MKKLIKKTMSVFMAIVILSGICLLPKPGSENIIPDKHIEIGSENDNNNSGNKPQFDDDYEEIQQ